MSGGNPKRYPRSLESNYSLLRIRAPEHLDVALEGLIRKVLKEQPKMDDIYQFAADYFDMLLKIREKAGVRKLTVQDICPHHNEEDAHEMIKLASSFTKRKKEPKQYRVLSLRNGERNKYRKFENFEPDDGVIGAQNEIPEPEDAPTRKTENEEAKKEEKFEKKEESENETEPEYSSKVSTKDTGEEIFIKANEVVTEYNKGEDTPNEALESNIDNIGDINEIRDKIKAVENEIELLGKKGDESVDKQFPKGEGETSGENQVETGEGSEKESSTEKETEATELDQATEAGEDESGTKIQESNQVVSDETEVPPEVEIIGELRTDSQKGKATSDDTEENRESNTETRAETEEASQVEEQTQGTLQDTVIRENGDDEEGRKNLERSLETQPEVIAVTEEEKNEVSNEAQVTEARKMETVEQEKEDRDDEKGEEPTETHEDSVEVVEVEKEEKDEDKGDELTETQEDSAVVVEGKKEETDGDNKDEPTENQEDSIVVTELEKEEKENDKKAGEPTKTHDPETQTPELEEEQREDQKELEGVTKTQEDVENVTEVEKEEKDDENKGVEPTETQDSAVVVEGKKEETDGDNKDEPTETQDSAVVVEGKKEETDGDNKDEPTETQDSVVVVEGKKEETDGDNKGEPKDNQEDSTTVTEIEKEEKEDDKKGSESAETQGRTEVTTETEEEQKGDQKELEEPTETQGDVEVTTEVEKQEKDETKEGGESAKVQGEGVAIPDEERKQEEEKELEKATKTQEDVEDVIEVEKEEKEGQKRSEEPLETEPEAKKGEEGDDDKTEQSTETQDLEAAPEKEKEGQEDDQKGAELAEAQGGTELIREEENEKEDKETEERTETQGGTEAEAEVKKEEKGGDDKEEPEEIQEDAEVPLDVKKEQEDQQGSEECKEVEPKVEDEDKGEERKEEGSGETRVDAETAAEVNTEEQGDGKKEESAESQGDTESLPQEEKELKEDQKGSEELTKAQGDTEREESENQKEIETTDLDTHLTTVEENKEQMVQKSDESYENLQGDIEEQKAEEKSPEEADVSEKTQVNVDIGTEVKENEVEDQKHSEETLDGQPDTEAGAEKKPLEKSPETQKCEDEITENESGRETAADGNSELEDAQQEASPTEKNDESSDSVPASTQKEEEGTVSAEGRRETLKDHIPNIGAQIIGNASQALISQETRNDMGLEGVKELKEKEISFGNESDKAEATNIQDFLTREREYSSYDKQGTDMKDSALQENSVESEIKSRNISVLGLTYGKELNTDNASVKVSVEEPDDAINVAADDYQERDTSTTSDEIEFEISPVKFPQAEQISKDRDEKSNVQVEPEIVLDLQTEDSEIKKEQDDEPKDETGKTFLRVPETVLEEYHIKKEPIVEEPQEGGEVILDCSNIGNEIIQTGEVEKVELLEGDEDILQVHLTTTIESKQIEGDSVSVEISSIEPNFKVYVETKMESPSQHSGNEEKLRMFRAAVVIQNGFRRFKNRKHSRELQFNDKPTDEENGEMGSKLEAISSLETSSQDTGTTVSTKISQKEKGLNRSTTRTLLETRSLEPFRKISPLKTRSLSTVRYGIGDFEVWNQLVQELEEAATKIQSNYRGYKTRKKLERGNAIQSSTITSEESDVPEYNQSHTGEFHDSIVLPYHPK